MLKFNAVFTTLNGIHLYTNNFYMIFIQNTGLIQLCTQIQTGLSAQIRQKRIRTFLCNDLFQTFHIQRFNIRHIRCLRICHNSCRVGIDQNNLITQFFQCLAGLSARIIEFAGLTDNNRTRTNNKYFMNVCSLWHDKILLILITIIDIGRTYSQAFFPEL